jgi:hypothetical protein
MNARIARALGWGCGCIVLLPACTAPQSQRQTSAQDASALAAEDALVARARSLQALAFRMADRWCAALDEAAAAVPKTAATDSRAALVDALRDSRSAVLAIGSGADSGEAVLDLLLHATLQCWTLRTNPAGNGVAREDAERVLASLDRAREELWSSASRDLGAAPTAELRLVIDAWVKARPDETRIARARIGDLASERSPLQAPDRERAARLIASSEVAASEAASSVDRTARTFDERALWYLSHYPALLGAQADATASRIARKAEADARAGREELARAVAAERAAFAEALSEERKALAAALTTERKAIAAALSEERAAFAETLAKDRAALVDALAKQREETSTDLAREREAMVAGVTKAVDASSTAAAVEREALTKWAGEERAAFAEDLETRLRALVDRGIMGIGIVAGALLVGLAALKFIPSRGRAPKS